MKHTLAVYHIAGALIAFALILFAISLVAAMRGGARGTKRREAQTYPYQQATRRKGGRRVIALVGRPLSTLLWATITPVGWLVANRRYRVVAPALRPFEEGLAAQNHRVDHALCVPILFWPQWLVRCRGCRAWVHLREVPAPGRAGVDLQVVRGALHGAGRCPARYLTAPQPANSAQSARPTVVTMDESA